MNLFYYNILDSLADDGESLKQIEHYFQYHRQEGTRSEIKKALLELLNEKMIYVIYPTDGSIDDIINSNDETIFEYWFHQTEKGREIWSSTDFDKLFNNKH
jgi:hypothetical protein